MSSSPLSSLHFLRKCFSFWQRGFRVVEETLFQLLFVYLFIYLFVVFVIHLFAFTLREGSGVGKSILSSTLTAILKATPQVIPGKIQLLRRWAAQLLRQLNKANANKFNYFYNLLWRSTELSLVEPCRRVEASRLESSKSRVERKTINFSKFASSAFQRAVCVCPSRCVCACVKWETTNTIVKRKRNRNEIRSHLITRLRQVACANAAN